MESFEVEVKQEQRAGGEVTVNKNNIKDLINEHTDNSMGLHWWPQK